jgi:hypothetical protein
LQQSDHNVEFRFDRLKAVASFPGVALHVGDPRLRDKGAGLKVSDVPLNRHHPAARGKGHRDDCRPPTEKLFDPSKV